MLANQTRGCHPCTTQMIAARGAARAKAAACHRASRSERVHRGFAAQAEPELGENSVAVDVHGPAIFCMHPLDHLLSEVRNAVLGAADVGLHLDRLLSTSCAPLTHQRAALPLQGATPPLGRGATQLQHRL